MPERRRFRILAVAVPIAFWVSGCAAPVVLGGLTVNEILTGFSLTSTLFSGKSLGEHALDAVSGRDCRFLEGVLRQDRALCEEPNSAATERDFKGLYAYLTTKAGERPAAPSTMFAAVRVDDGWRELAPEPAPTLVALDGASVGWWQPDNRAAGPGDGLVDLGKFDRAPSSSDADVVASDGADLRGEGSVGRWERDSGAGAASGAELVEIAEFDDALTLSNPEFFAWAQVNVHGDTR